MDHEKLRDLFDQWSIQHFRPEEVTRLSRWNTHRVPDDDLLGNIEQAIRIADSARSALGAPVRCTSGYRPEEYNSLVGGSPTSEHMDFKALDLQPVDSGQMGRFRSIVSAIVNYARHLGIDVRVIHYATFVHIDVNADPEKPRTGLDAR